LRFIRHSRLPTDKPGNQRNRLLNAEGFIGHIRQGHESRTGKIIAPEDADAGCVQPVIFRSIFNPFGHDFNGQLVADMLDAGKDTLLDKILPDGTDQNTVEFDVIRLVLRQ